MTPDEIAKVRTSFAQFLGKPPSTIPAQYLSYLACDALATWHLFGALHRAIRRLDTTMHATPLRAERVNPVEHQIGLLRAAFEQE